VLLYAVQLSARYLDAFVNMTLRPPRVGLTNRDRIDELVGLGLGRTTHLWFLTEAEELKATPNATAAAMTFAPDEVRYYRNPLDRLRKMHQNANEIMTGFNYVSPWA
jgi:hypothetical protein